MKQLRRLGPQQLRRLEPRSLTRIIRPKVLCRLPLDFQRAKKPLPKSGEFRQDSRPGFAAMLERIEGNGVRTIIVETASRFARDLMVQEVGHAKLRERGIDLIAADNPGSFIDDTPTAKLVRQVLGAISEFDKAMTVAKLRGARERKRRENGKCEGRKSHAELNPELVVQVRQLRRRRPKGGQRSLREISAELAQRGIMNERGSPFSAASINSMLR